MTKRKTGLRVAAFLLIFFILFMLVQECVTPDHNWPIARSRLGDSVRGIYKESSDSVQMLFLGTSHMKYGMTPMVIYRETGIRSYSLATSAQSLNMSYMLLKQTLERQNLKVVVLDGSGFFYDQKRNGRDVHWKDVIDSLSWKRIRQKFELAVAHSQLNGGDMEDLVSGVVPMLRYHSNYLLKSSDFINANFEKENFLKGYSFSTTVEPAEDYSDEELEALNHEYFLSRRDINVLDTDDEYEDEDAEAGQADAEADDEGESPSDREETGAATEEGEPGALYRYNLSMNMPIVRQIADLCKSHGCELVLTKIPVHCLGTRYSGFWNRDKQDLVAGVAEELGCPFIDLQYADIGMDWSTDTLDGGKHLNMSGARKTSSFLGEAIAEKFDLDTNASDEVRRVWDYELDLYNSQENIYELKKECSLEKYLDLLAESDYTVFAVVHRSAGLRWKKAFQEKLTAITGAQFDLTQLPKEDRSTAFLAVGVHGQSIEEMQDSLECSVEGVLEDGTTYKLSSASKNSGKKTSVVINGDTYKTYDTGFMFVVYDSNLQCVIDSACFNTGKKTLNCTHNFTGKSRSRFFSAMNKNEQEAMAALPR